MFHIFSCVFFLDIDTLCRRSKPVLENVAIVKDYRGGINQFEANNIPLLAFSGAAFCKEPGNFLTTGIANLVLAFARFGLLASFVVFSDVISIVPKTLSITL